MSIKAFRKFTGSNILDPKVPYKWNLNEKTVKNSIVLHGLARKRVEHLHQALDDAEVEIVDHVVKPDRFFFLRPSGFPYCGLRKLMSAPDTLIEGQNSNLAGSYFTSVGTAAHTVFQSHIGRLGEVVGDWKCKHCGKFTKFTTFKKCDCGHKPEYEELEIEYKNTVVGHLDGLVRLKERTPDGKRKYVVIDYKTATGAKIKKGLTDPTVFPYEYNVQQIKRYVILMELCFGIHVEGWALIYLNRDVPLGRKNRHIVYREVKDAEKAELVAEMKRWIRIHRRVLQAHTREDFDYVKDNKLCKSHKDYTENWESPYQPCPCLPYCFNSQKLEHQIEKKIKMFGRQQSKTRIYPMINMAPGYLQEWLNMEPLKLPHKKEST